MHPQDNDILSLTDLLEADSFARLKTRLWVRNQILAGHLRAMNTGTPQRAMFYIKWSDWIDFKNSLVFDPDEKRGRDI